MWNNFYSLSCMTAIKKIDFDASLKIRIYIFLQLCFQRHQPGPLHNSCAASQNLRTKKKKWGQVKEGMSSPIKCFSAVLSGQNTLLKIPLLLCVCQIVWGPQTKTVAPMFSFEYICEKQPPGARWAQTQIPDFIWTIIQTGTSTHLNSNFGIIRNNN